jgi:hypothetical protein
MRLRRFSWLAVAGLMASVCPLVPAQEPQTGSKYFPSNTQAVITINFRQMLESPLVKPDLPKLQEQIKANAEAQRWLGGLGFDPLKDFDSVTVAMAGVEDQDQAVIVARGKFDTAKFKAKAEEFAKEQKDAIKVHQAGGNTIYETNFPQQQKPMFVAMIDNTTVVAAIKQSDVAAALDVKAGKKQNEVKKELQGLLAKSNPKQSFSVVMLGNALSGVPFGDQVENISGGITIGDDIRTDFVIATKDAAAAKALAEQIQQGLETAKQLLPSLAPQAKEAVEVLDVLKVDAKDTTVTIKGDVTKEMLEKLKKAAERK